MDFFSYLEQYTSLISIYLSKNQKELFYSFYKIFIEKNQILNLSRIHNLEEIIRKHYIDSIILLKILEKYHLELKDPIMDLGTGAGFPGLPLAILKPEFKFLLVESRKKRVEYLEFVKHTLNLRNIEVIHKTLNFKDEIKVETVLTRALETIKETAIRTASSLKENGYLIFYKGPNCQKEILEINPLFFEKILEEDYILPNINPNTKSNDKRKIIIFKKKVDAKVLLQQTSRYYFTMSKEIRIKEIQSKENEFYKLLKKLSNSNDIRKNQLAIVAGKKIVNEYIENVPDLISYFIFSKDLDEEKLSEYYQKLKNHKIQYIYLHSELIQNLEIKDYSSPYIMIRIPKIQEVQTIKEKCIILPLQDPVNLGSCIRSAYAFGIKNIILTKESCNPFLLKSIRSSAGYVIYCNFFRVLNVVDLILSNSLPVYALHTKGIDITKITQKEKLYGYILGEEGRGIPEDILNLKTVIPISIPMKTSIDSLNVSVSCGIGLFYIENLNT